MCLTPLLLAIFTSSSIAVGDIDLTQIRQGWGNPMRNMSVTRTPIQIAGRRFSVGLGTHAKSLFRIRLDGKALRLHSFCGVDDNAKSPEASIEFRIVGDGKELWRSGVLRWNQPAVEADVVLTGVRMLSLIVEDGGNGIGYDHADWAEARIEYTGRVPSAAYRTPEQAVILTPPPPREPRVNGPGVIGVRPGSPFLYLLPVSGDRPMRYSAKNLPPGLHLDVQTGIVTGRIGVRGEHLVQFSAKNARGAATRQIRIVCGDEFALTPQMGWNSWYVWTDSVSDEIMRKAADAMVSTGLAQHGWQFVNIDDCWARMPGRADPDLGRPTRSTDGAILPNAKFPDMRALTDYIHAKGLKAGIYTSPGPTTCAGYEGALGHEEQDAQTFADWGFDLLKYDWCSYRADGDGPTGLKKPYRLIGDILKKQRRDIVLNLCQYGMGQVWTWGKSVGGHSWRTAGDLGIGYTLFEDAFALYANERLERYAGPGSFNDPDYLLLGEVAGEGGKHRKTPFTPNEQYTQVSMWCLLAAPLILSGDITTLDPFTLSLLTNDEVLGVDQDALVKAAHRAAKVGETEVWARPLEDGGMAVGLFNLGEEAQKVTVTWQDLGIGGFWSVRDLWRQKAVGYFSGSYSTLVGRHGVALIKLTRAASGGPAARRRAGSRR